MMAWHTECKHHAHVPHFAYDECGHAKWSTSDHGVVLALYRSSAPPPLPPGTACPGSVPCALCPALKYQPAPVRMWSCKLELRGHHRQRVLRQQQDAVYEQVARLHAARHTQYTVRSVRCQQEKASSNGRLHVTMHDVAPGQAGPGSVAAWDRGMAVAAVARIYVCSSGRVPHTFSTCATPASLTELPTTRAPWPLRCSPATSSVLSRVHTCGTHARAHAHTHTGAQACIACKAWQVVSTTWHCGDTTYVRAPVNPNAQPAAGGHRLAARSLHACGGRQLHPAA